MLLYGILDCGKVFFLKKNIEYRIVKWLIRIIFGYYFEYKLINVE